jgi:aminotransferase
LENRLQGNNEMEMINVYQPKLVTEEILAVSEVFESNWIGRGAKVAQFESDFASYVGLDTKHFVSTTSCTEALFQIIDLIKKDGGEVVIPAVSFVGAANAILSAGMNVVFCDVDPLTGNARVSDVEAKITNKTVAVLVQHQGGMPCEILAISELCRTKNIYVVEDSAGALGTTVNGKHCGTFADFGCWSFDAMKMVVAGDGGMIYASETAHIEALREKTYLGLSATSGATQAQQHDRWWEFDVNSPSRRSIMNDVNAAIGIVQLRKLDKSIETRLMNYLEYQKQFAVIDSKLLETPAIPKNVKLSHYFYPVLVSLGKRDELAIHMRGKKIYTTFRYYPLNKVNLYKNGVYLADTESYADRMLLLPQHQSLSENDLKRITSNVLEFFR